MEEKREKLSVEEAEQNSVLEPAHENALEENGVEKERRGKKPTESARLVRAHGEYAVGITLEPMWGRCLLLVCPR